MKILSLNSTIMALLVAATSFSTIAKVQETTEKVFEVSASSSFEIENVNGEINIKTWSQPSIQVNAIITGKTQQDVDSVFIDMQQVNNGVTVETKYEKSGWGKNNHKASVDYTIMLPEDHASTEVELVNGSLSIINVNGDVKTDLVNGSTFAEGVNGNGEFNAVNGSISVSFNRFSDNVEKISVDSVNGRVELNVPNDIDASFSVETMNGSIKNDFGMSVNKNMFSGKSLEGSVGSGQIQVDIESVNGAIKIAKK